jgi:hypothetical protein
MNAAPSTHLRAEDLHTLLAAVRFMQSHLPSLPEEIQAIATNDGERPVPDAQQLDLLCQVINIDLPTIPSSE